MAENSQDITTICCTTKEGFPLTVARKGDSASVDVGGRWVGGIPNEPEEIRKAVRELRELEVKYQHPA